jgi:Repeat of unknown function (DUF5648)
MKFARDFCTSIIGMLWILNPVDAAISPDPTFGVNGVMEIRLGATGSQPQIFKFHTDPRGNLWAVGYVRDDTTTFPVLRQFLYAADQNGKARSEAGDRGFIFPSLGGCTGSEPGIASTADTIFIASTVSPGLGCDGRSVRLWSVSASDGFRPKTILDKLPGEDRAAVSVQADGRVAVATAKEDPSADYRYTVRFYRAGVDNALQPGFTWNTTATPPQLVFIGAPPFSLAIQAAKKGDWILSYRYMATFTDLRLTPEMNAIKIPESSPEPKVTFGYEGQPYVQTQTPILTVKDFDLKLAGNVVDARNRVSGAVTSFTINSGDEAFKKMTLAPNGDVLWVDNVNLSGVRVARKRWLNGQYAPVEFWHARMPSRVQSLTHLIPNAEGSVVHLAYRTGSGTLGTAEDVDPWRVVRLQLVESAATTYAVDAVVEFFNADLNHYFITASALEVDLIGYGAAGPGWKQTGLGFYAFEKSPPANAVPVCRFYGQPPLGPNSHFYTLDPIECEAVKKDRGWKFEGIAFHAIPPINGQCPAATEPVWRAYNNGYLRNDSNHRYSTDRSVLAALKGWTLEGIVFCSPN